MNQQNNLTGLSDKQVLENRQKHGENILSPPQRESLWKLFWEKFEDPVIRILLVAAFVSLGISFVHNEFAETIGIFCAIILSVGIAFWFEMDANKKFNILNQVNDDTLIKVIRNGYISEIPKKEIVVGDIIVLDTGEEIPADAELLEAIGLQVNESSLTGEPVIAKTTKAKDFHSDTTYPSNMIYRGTTVVDGHCTAIVTTVGDNTEFGKVAREAAQISGEQTPLNKQLAKLARLIASVGICVAVLTFVILSAKTLFFDITPFNFSKWLNIDVAGKLLQNFMVAVALIVMAVPEGLPMSVTLNLAMNMRRMLKTNNLVRKMHACETMGAATVICTDKTGTLTQNQMQVWKHDFYDLQEKNLDNLINQVNPGSDIIYESIAVNSTAHLDFSDTNKAKVLGNPTEGALLLWMHKNGINYLPLRENAKVLEQLTFSTERKYMVTIVDSPSLNKKVLYVKGAPEIILDLCTSIPVAKKEIHKQLLEYQNKAMRTLGFAYQMIDDNAVYIHEGKLQNVNLAFLGIVAISDPVRKDVPIAVSACLNAGIDVKIVTGDTPGTAKEIGRQIGIWKSGDTDENIMTGPEYEALTDEEALNLSQKLKIMCRARPTDKQRLVQMLQKKGNIVAVTGDGTNDAPALNFAQVGLSMGTGTSIAKEASDITLLDDSFNSIATAVMWGRSLYKNIQRFILFQLTINVTALILVFLGSLFGRELPLTITQILWVNLIMDTLAAGALASLPPDSEVMKDKPRKHNDFIITKSMQFHILFTGITFAALLLGLLYSFGNPVFLSKIFSYIPEQERTAYSLSFFFTTFVMLQFWNLFNTKAFYTKHSAFAGIKKCKGFVFALILILAGQFLIVELGGNIFRTVPLTLRDWGIIIGITSLVLWIGEIRRFTRGALYYHQ